MCKISIIDGFDVQSEQQRHDAAVGRRWIIVRCAKRQSNGTALRGAALLGGGNTVVCGDHAGVINGWRADAVKVAHLADRAHWLTAIMATTCSSEQPQVPQCCCCCCNRSRKASRDAAGWREAAREAAEYRAKVYALVLYKIRHSRLVLASPATTDPQFISRSWIHRRINERNIQFTRWSKHKANLEHTSCTCILITIFDINIFDTTGDQMIVFNFHRTHCLLLHYLGKQN